MKKLLLITLLLSMTAHAEITVINESNKASPATVFATAYSTALADSKFYQSQNCEEAKNKFESTKNAVMIYNSSVEFAARDKGLDCRLETAKITKVVYIGKQYMSICSVKGGPSFTDNKVLMGMPSMYSTKLHEQEYINNKINAKLVPYGGSKDIITAVLSGDITHGFVATSMASKIKEFDCQYSTNPADSNYLGNAFKLKVPDFRVTYVVYTNSTDENIIATLKNVENDKQFSAFLNSTGTISNWKVKSTDVLDVTKFVDYLSSAWSSNKKAQQPLIPM